MLTSIRKSFSPTAVCRALIVFALLSAPSLAYQIPEPYWTSKIDSALHVRDFFYRSVLQDTLNFSISELNKIQQSELCSRLLYAPDTTNPWYTFLLGILECDREKTDSSSYFAKALTLAQQDPGTTWALFIEFTRNQKTVWAERCLLHLEKLLLATGAQSAPAIAQQLLYYAYLSEKQKNYQSAFGYYRWAERFDRNQPWSLFHRLLKCLPSHLQLFVTTFEELTQVVYHSWILQLHGAAYLYTWLHYFLIVFVMVIFTGIGLRYIPQAVHFLADRLPEDTPAPLKTLLPICLTLSFVSFGLIPFLLLIFFITWRFTDNKDRFVLAIAFLMLVCSPVDARIRDMFRQALMPQGSLVLCIRASEEGYSPALHQRALEKIVIDRSDALAFMTASLCALKKGDTAAACLNANSALSLRPNDPSFLLLAGNAAFASNDYKTAASLYQKILSKYPNRMDARFNLAQCYARKSDTTVDLDFMKTLSTQDQIFINNFTNTNNMYFSNNWPVMRQIIPLSFTAFYFWKNIFPVYNGSWTSTKNLWGASFCGLPPYLSLSIFIVLTLLFIVWNIILVVTKRERYTVSCRLCKRALCDNCKKGDLCVSCFRATRFIRNVKMLAATQALIIEKRQAYYRFLEYLLDILLPGSGMLFAKRHSPALIAFVIILSSIVYASYLFLTNIHTGYPLWVVYDKLEIAPYFLGLYNVIFVFRALLGFFRKKEPVLI
jgi:tetratricopeptide (TPR) repeat protein